MLFRVVRPMKRKESSKGYFHQRIPIDVINAASGVTLAMPVGNQVVTKVISPKAVHIKISLRTSDPSTIKARQAIVAAYLEGVWRSLRSGPTTLSHKQCVALSGEIYKAFVDGFEEEPRNIEAWDKVLNDNALALRGEFGSAKLKIGNKDYKVIASLEERFGDFTDLSLAQKGLIVTDESRHKLLRQTASALNDAAASIRKFAEGDYSHSEANDRFPVWEATNKPKAKQKAKVSIHELLEDWWKEAKLDNRSISTYESYARTIEYFRKFICSPSKPIGPKYSID